MPTRTFQVVWLKVTFPGKLGAAVGLGIKSWFAALGPNTSDCIWGILSPFKFLFFCFLFLATLRSMRGLTSLTSD